MHNSPPSHKRRNEGVALFTLSTARPPSRSPLAFASHIKDDPEGTHGAEVCHLDRIVLQQTWLCLASDGPGNACLKQCGSVDDYCDRQNPRSGKSRRGSSGDDGDSTTTWGGDGYWGQAGAAGGGGGEGRGSRQVRY